jgi:Immunity protein 35
MSRFNLPLFILIIILSIIVYALLTKFTDLSLWLAIPLAPIVSFITLVAFSLTIEMLEPKEEVKSTTIPIPEDPSDFILSLKPDGLLCPSCGSDKVIEIIYGLPAITQKIQKELEKKTITLGGCMVHENAPLWMCAICNCKFDHPVNKEQALKIVQNIIKNWDLPEGDKYIVVESGTIEKEWGWVFFYTSKKYFQTNDINYAVAGNAPFIVLRKSGRVIETGTAYPIEHYINRFEETGDPHS